MADSTIIAAIIAALATILAAVISLFRAKLSSSKKQNSIDSFDDLPTKTYTRLLGREQEIENFLSILRDPNAKTIISLTGLGGIGKTAIAREVLEKCQKEELFEAFLWETGVEEVFSGGDIHRFSRTPLSLSRLRNSIAKRLGNPDAANDRFKIRSLLNKTRTLIIVDSLENAIDYRALVSGIEELATKNSRFILTSRLQLSDYDSIYSIVIKGLEENDSLLFLQLEGQDRGIQSIAQANENILRKIYETTGGAPLAMKLLVGQVSRLPIEEVLQKLKSAIGSAEKMYTFIYRTSWKLLNPNARKVLIAMPAFPSSAIQNAIGHVSTVTGYELTNALHELVTLSLLDVGAGLTESDKRYNIHQLTRQFLNTELPDRWT